MNLSFKVEYGGQRKPDKHIVFRVQTQPKPNAIEFEQCFSSMALTHPLCSTLRKNHGSKRLSPEPKHHLCLNATQTLRYR